MLGSMLDRTLQKDGPDFKHIVISNRFHLFETPCNSFPGQTLTVEDPRAGGVSLIVLLVSSPRIFILIIIIIIF